MFFPKLSLLCGDAEVIPHECSDFLLVRDIFPLTAILEGLQQSIPDTHADQHVFFRCAGVSQSAKVFDEFNSIFQRNLLTFSKVIIGK